MYDPAAQKRWLDKNPERRKYLTHKRRARSFFTRCDMNEMQTIIHERRKFLTSDEHTDRKYNSIGGIPNARFVPTLS